MRCIVQPCSQPDERNRIQFQNRNHHKSGTPRKLTMRRGSEPSGTSIPHVRETMIEPLMRTPKPTYCQPAPCHRPTTIIVSEPISMPFRLEPLLPPSAK